MQWSTIYNVFVRDFRKQKKRITLTIIALCWGTISIMLLLGFGEGLRNQLLINSKGMGDKIAVIWPGSTSIPYKGLGKGRPLHYLPEDIEYLKTRVPELEEVGGEYHRWGVTVKNGDKVVSEHVNGVTPNYEFLRNHIAQMGGRMINDADVKAKRRVAFLGDALKDRLFGAEDPVGKIILVQGMPFTVVGVQIHKMQMNSYSG
ncbi:MAG: ABC transporter permease, partial [candidate division Zixibacteria bacterium]|nr:ABC transporter permease [candidate division Zixibacteria bacterium]